MARLFVALDLPPSVTGQLADWLGRPPPPVRPTPPEKMHLTLRFLGETDEELVTRALEAVSFPSPFPLTVRGTGCFASRRVPRVFWAGVEPSPPLLALREGVERSLLEAGWVGDGRAWCPHVTLARVRKLRPAEKEDLERFRNGFLEAGATRALAPHEVRSFLLFASEPEGRGRRYRVVREFFADSVHSRGAP